MENNLNVLKTGYSPWRYPSNIPTNIKNFFKTIKYAYQRATKGYSDWDVWDLDYYYTNLFIVTLRDLAKTSHSYPGNEEFPTYESWTDYLNKMADLFEASLDESGNIYQKEYDELTDRELKSKTFEEMFNKKRTPEEQEIVSKWLEDEKRLYAERVEKRNAALTMLAHVYDTLWD